MDSLLKTFYVEISKLTRGDFSMHKSVCSVFTPLLIQRFLTGVSETATHMVF